MITLYGFQPAGGLPDASPFVVKAMALLKMAGLDYELDPGGFAKAPKGKKPYIRDGGELIADSTFIRFHLEQAHGVDFDSGLTEEQKAIGWCAEKMCEEHLYWVIAYSLWLDEANFERGPAKFFNKIPAFARPLAKWYMRRRVRKNLRSQGLGRHSPAEINALGVHDIEALAALLGDKPYLCGEEPCGADATVFAFVAAVMSPLSETPYQAAALSKPNLVAYRGRMMGRYFPDAA
ncbi:MAG: glutathione S-transferase [Methylocystis sp.]|nr:MAG: glutathione S-transferase [Methylocystis sp.]